MPSSVGSFVGLTIGVASAGKTPTNLGTTYTIANALDNTTVHKYNGEFFDWLTDPIQTQYSEVFWQAITKPLPQDVVSRFDDKVMVIKGYEVDIVRGDTLDNLTSVPCFEQYNHHYTGFLHGKAASVAQDATILVDGSPVVGGHGEPLVEWDVSEIVTIGGVLMPSVQVVSEGNGNEHRGSWHGSPKGYGMLLYSPRSFQLSPMIINTNKRLTNDTSSGPINHDLVPSSVLSPPDSTYSGLLECPCTTRKIKVLDGYSLQWTGDAPSGTSEIHSVIECVAAAKVAGVAEPNASNVESISDPARPAGCFATSNVGSETVPTAAYWSVFFNDLKITGAAASAECGSGSVKPTPGGILTAGAFVAGEGEAADVNVNVNASLALNATSATITLSGPADGHWFAIAFNATSMADTPYAIVVDGTGAVQEHRLGDRTAGSVLPSSVQVVSSSVVEGTRVVTLSRPIIGATAAHYTFDITSKSINVLAAHGTSSALAYHGPSRVAGSMNLVPPGAALCISRDPSSNKGTIAGRQFNPNVCAPYPTSELWTTHNAICNISEYGGGLYCCSGGTYLLNEDQTVPEPMDEWRIRFRFYFEEYNNTRARSEKMEADGSGLPQSNLFRMWWSTEATNNEYDVPKSQSDCLDPATPPENCTHTLVSRFTGRDMVAGPAQCMVGGAASAASCANVTKIQAEYNSTYNLIYAAAHCHSPACISLELWNDDTGELLCRNDAVYGTSVEAQNESSYIVAIPPCLWGSAEEGLRPPPAIHLNSNLSTVKRANNTNGHWGTMALWQMRGAYLRN